MKAETLSPSVSNHGEGLCWDASISRMLWVDMLAGDVLATDPESGYTERWPGPTDHMAMIRPRKSAGWLAALGDTIATAEELGGAWTRANWTIDSDAEIFNEGGCNPDGQLYVGTAARDEVSPVGHLYVVTSDGPLVILEGITLSNGLAFTTDPSIAYYTDSMTKRIDRLRFEGPVARPHREPVAEIEIEGLPDGLCVDSQGAIWVAIWGAGEVHRYTPNGELSEIVQVGAPNPTACQFGKHDLATLFISTSRLETDIEMYPAAGALHAVSPGIAGLPTMRAAG